jgi:hypothetical protein
MASRTLFLFQRYSGIEFLSICLLGAREVSLLTALIYKLTVVQAVSWASL